VVDKNNKIYMFGDLKIYYLDLYFCAAGNIKYLKLIFCMFVGYIIDYMLLF
jgi:hypothetical protein